MSGREVDGAPVIDVRGLGRAYGPVVALDGVDLVVRPGEVVGLLGPNGAGKSTLLAVLAGLRRATSGTVRVLGGDPRDARVRVGLGVTPQETGLPATLRVREVLDLVAGHHRNPAGADELLARFGLTGLERRQTGGLSGGQRRRLALALAFAGRPRLVLLDEPTTGLDVDARRAVWEQVRAFHAAGGTVVVTSHHVGEVEALAGRVVVVHAGRVLVDGPTAEVTRRVGLRRLRYRVAGRLIDDLVPDADDAVRRLVRDAVPFEDLEVCGAGLEEAFLALTGGPR